MSDPSVRTLPMHLSDGLTEKPTEADLSRKQNVPEPLALLRQGIGLATDLYDLSIINMIRPDFEATYGKLTPWEDGLMTSASHLGALFGQLVLGYFADRLGRRRLFILTAFLMFAGALGAASTTPLGSLSAARVLTFWRFVLGVGIGGEYPLSGAITAENAPTHASALHMALLCLCFMAGQILSPVVVLTCLYSGLPAESVWRLGIGCGALLALFAGVLRMSTMQETQEWLESRSASMSGAQTFSTMRALFRPLAGTFLCWLIYDVISYGTGAYTTTLFRESDRISTTWNVLLIVALSAPGYFFTLCVGRFGRRCFQLTGFLGMAVCFFAMSKLYGHAAVSIGVFVFGVQKTFDAFGPGAMTFIIPAEIFPTAVRASCHGISAAGGKFGAFIGTFLLPYLQEQLGAPTLLLGCGLLAIAGVGCTYLLTPSYDSNVLQEVRATTLDHPSYAVDILFKKRLMSFRG